jgi:hypothetical protein
MAVKSKIGASATRTIFTPGKPKRTKQGQGRNSKANHNRKQLRGQGR